MNDYTKLHQEISVWRNLYEQTMQAGHCSSEAKARADAALLAFREAFPGPFERDYTAMHAIPGTVGTAQFVPGAGSAAPVDEYEVEKAVVARGSTRKSK